MYYRALLFGFVSLALLGCESELPDIQFEKFRGGTEVNLEPELDQDSNAGEASSESTEAQTDAAACIDGWISDGWCDIQNNRAECAYDGGDCCPSTCESNAYSCGDYQWICIDPEACESTGECEPAPGNVEMTYEEFCEMYPEFCDDIDDCEQFPELCDPELYCEMYPENCVTYEEYCAMFPDDPLCESYDSSDYSSGDVGRVGTEMATVMT